MCIRDSTYTDRNALYIISIPLPGDGCYSFSVYDKNGVNAGLDYFTITGPSGEVLAHDGYVSFYARELFNIQQANHPIANNGACLLYTSAFPLILKT